MCSKTIFEDKGLVFHMNNAEKKWFFISEDIREKLLHNVWCTNCKDAVEIINYSISGNDVGVILIGKCKTCDHNVARVIEEL